MARIYVASSWRNPYFPDVVKRLREAGHEVYDFRNPPHGGAGFHWTDIDPDAPNWTYAQYAEGLRQPLAERQFQADIDALTWADTCVLVLPCGRSAHTEPRNGRARAHVQALRRGGWQSGGVGGEDLKNESGETRSHKLKRNSIYSDASPFFSVYSCGNQFNS